MFGNMLESCIQRNLDLVKVWKDKNHSEPMLTTVYQVFEREFDNRTESPPLGMTVNMELLKGTSITDFEYYLQILDAFQRIFMSFGAFGILFMLIPLAYKMVVRLVSLAGQEAQCNLFSTIETTMFRDLDFKLLLSYVALAMTWYQPGFVCYQEERRSLVGYSFLSSLNFHISFYWLQFTLGAVRHKFENRAIIGFKVPTLDRAFYNRIRSSSYFSVIFVLFFQLVSFSSEDAYYGGFEVGFNICAVGGLLAVTAIEMMHFLFGASALRSLKESIKVMQQNPTYNESLVLNKIRNLQKLLRMMLLLNTVAFLPVYCILLLVLASEVFRTQLQPRTYTFVIFCTLFLMQMVVSSIAGVCEIVLGCAHKRKGVGKIHASEP